MDVLLLCSGCDRPMARVDADRYRVLPSAGFCPRCAPDARLRALLRDA